MADNPNNSSKFHIIYIIIIVVLLAGLIGEYYYFNKKISTIRSASPRVAGVMTGAGGRPGGMRMPMMKVQKPDESDQQKAQLAVGTSTSTTQKTFNITGGNFYFVPNKITVNKGDQVTFVMTNGGGMHDLVIDELGVKTPVIQSGAAATATFTASKTGSFVYYCNIPGHRQKGMWGTLVVQ